MGNSKTESNQRWKDANIDRLTFVLPKGKKEIIRAYALSKGKTITSYIIDLIEQDTGMTIHRQAARRDDE